MTDAHDRPGARTGDTVEVALPDDSTAPGVARRGVRDTLKRWRLPTLIDACVLAASELVTNAFRHGRPPIGLSLRRRSDQVRLDVSDADPHLVSNPGNDDVDDLAESGRGLDIVRAVADDVGSEGIPDDGKRMFASWRLSPDSPPTHRTSGTKPASRSGAENTAKRVDPA